MTDSAPSPVQPHPLVPYLRAFQLVLAGAVYTARRKARLSGEVPHACCIDVLRATEERLRRAVKYLEGGHARKPGKPLEKFLIEQRRAWLDAAACPYKHECTPTRRRKVWNARPGVARKPRVVRSRRSLEDRRRQQDLMDEGLL